MATLLITAAGETSKVPFYVLGGVLALYAVILAAIGIKRPDFPFGAGGTRGVMAMTFVLAVLAIAASVTTA